MDKLTKAKAQLIINQPFFASILLGQEIELTEAIPTMATDGEKIMVNPKWTETLTIPEIIFVLAHEVLHCVLEHMHRRGARDPKKWNIATDYVINGVLIQDKIGQAPEGILIDDSLVARGGGTADGVYGILPEPKPKDKDSSGGNKPGSNSGNKPGKKPGDKPANDPNGSPGHPGPGEDGGPLDSLVDNSPDEATRNEKISKAKIRVIEAHRVAKMAGKTSEGLDRLIGEATRSKVNWRGVLRQFLSERCKEFYSFAKPNRRFISEDLILPSLVGDKMGSVVIAVDCSGSVDDKLLALFGSEINGILEDTNTSEINIVYFDAKVLRVQNHRPDEHGPIKLEPIGGGGTRFSPIWEAVGKLETPPICCIILTDLECNDFGKCPDYPILWASTQSQNAPFGEILRIED